MKRLSIYMKGKKILLEDESIIEIIFDENEYKDIIKNIENKKYPFFKFIKNEYRITKKEEIEKNFLYLFNFIIFNNIANYIIDRYKEGEFEEIIFDKSIKNIKKQIIKSSSSVGLVDALGNIITSLINSNEYLDGRIKMDYEELEKLKKSNTVKINLIEYFFRYTTNEVKALKDKLEIDLIAFEFLKDKVKNSRGRYELPIYVNHNELVKKGLENYPDYIMNWLSIAYLEMLIKIHDYFVKYYKLDYEKGLRNDNLMIGLIDMLDFKMMPYPSGLRKSIEVGRSTAGKCYFIEGIIKPIAISQDLAMILQAKDAFNIVPKLFKKNI